MPATSTTSWSLLPPPTREVQLDEKWSFVAKKEKNCDPTDPADDRKGDTWDHVAIDAESRTMDVSNFCWPVRTLRVKDEEGRWQKRCPAMAAGLADHIWSIPEWLAFPSVRCK